MGHFTIHLSENQVVDVKWGTIKKKSLLTDLFRSRQSSNEVRKGYIVKINEAGESSEYRLLKTTEGKWTSEDAGGFQVTPDDELTASIKNEIDNYETQH